MAAKGEATAVGLGEGRQMNAANVKEGNIHPMSLSSSGKSEQEGITTITRKYLSEQ
jgi:hypothetical protein